LKGGRSINLFQPFFSPEDEAGAITPAKIRSSLTQDALEEDNAITSLDPEITLVHKSFHKLMDPLSRTAVFDHLGHKGATPKLSPMV
jgi:hypothetical protein